MSRRHFITRGVMGLGSLAVLPRWAKAGADDPVLEEKHQQLFESFARIFLPAGTALGMSASDLGGGPKFMEIVGGMPSHIQRGIGIFLWIFDRIPYARFNFTRISRMKPEDQSNQLTRLMNSDSSIARALYLFMKEFVMLSTFSNPKVYPAIGYEAACE